MAPSIVWFRRDLRLADHPALLAAAERHPSALALYVLDDRLIRLSGKPRLAFLYGCLRALDERLGGRLLVTRGDPVEVVPMVAAAYGASSVHVSADAGPYGRERDKAVEEALSGVDFVRTGSPYAVTPGRVTKGDGSPYKVFTPFSRAWAEHGWRSPARTDVSTLDWIDLSGAPWRVEIPAGPSLAALPEPGEEAALAAWEAFRDERLPGYASRRDRPDLDGTSRMSAYLRWGCIHPRTMLADLGPADTVYRAELAWREFYADVLWHRPETARENVNPKFDALRHDTGELAAERFSAWCRGETGYPIVDAGMRQLLVEGWMHNRVRMITASFLTKDLHVPWWWGARHFMKHLVDGDLASNQHGWQWTAGTGTDAAPYFRVFNPTAQGRKFDPDGVYVRRYVPQLRDFRGDVHSPVGVGGYPVPIVDHGEERKVALARYAEL